MVVRTHTYTVVKYANPHLVCTKCGLPVRGHRTDNTHNYPCNHKDYKSTCNSWSPVDGCTCKESHE